MRRLRASRARLAPSCPAAAIGPAARLGSSASTGFLGAERDYGGRAGCARAGCVFARSCPAVPTAASVLPPASVPSEPKEIHRVIVGPDGWGESDTSWPPALADAQGDAAPSPSSRSSMQAGSGTAVEVSSGGAYAVQVSSERSAAEARASFRALRAKFPNQLGGREPMVRRTDLGAKGIYYRAMVGPFASMEKAAGMCRTLKAAGCNCLVQRN